MNALHCQRRSLIKAGLALGLAPSLSRAATHIQTRPIPASDEPLPVIGLGTWRTFDVRGWWWEMWERRAIVDLMIERGASVIDTSPKYGRAEEIVGEVLEDDDRRASMFVATKVWTDGKKAGLEQMRNSSALLKSPEIDLMLVHDLRDIDTQMGSIKEQQDAGLIRYNGVSEWRESALDELETVLKKYRPQFLEINYSLGERDAEKRILPLARDMGIAVLINRPYLFGKLFGKVGKRPLPDWSTEFADSWGQFFLKFILSHSAVNCVIPGTSKMHHMEDNLAAGIGPMPDATTRERMVKYFANL